MKIITLFLVTVAILAGSESSGEYFGFVTNGDKPSIGISLSFKNGIIQNGSIMILSPEFPIVKDAQVMPLVNIVRQGGKINCGYFINEKDFLNQKTEILEIEKQTDEKIILTWTNREFTLTKVAANQ